MPSILVATGFVRIDSDTKPALKGLKALGSIGASALTTALLPASAAIVTAVGAISAATAVAGAGLAVYGVAVKQQFSQVQEAMQKQKTAQDAQSKATNATTVAQQLAKEGGFKYGQQVKITANMTEAARLRADNYNKALATATSQTKAAKVSQEAYKGAIGGMPKATAKLTESLQKLKDDTKAWSDSLASSTMPVFTRGVEFLDRLLPKLSPIVRLIANDIDNFSASLGEGQAGRVFREFGANVQKFSGGTLKGLLGTFKNITVGIVGILNAFTPMSVGVSGGLEKMTAKFATWGATLGKSGGFKTFTEIGKKTGPKLLEFFRVLADALVKVASAAGPMAGVSLTLLTIFTQLIDAIPTPVLKLLVPTLLAVNLGMKLYALYTSIAAGVTWLFTTSVTTSTGAVYASRLAMILHRIAVIASTTATAVSTAVTWLARTAMLAFRYAVVLVRLSLALLSLGFRLLAIAMLTTPIGLIITGILLLAVAFFVAWKKSESFRNMVKAALGAVKDAAVTVGKWFAGPFVDTFTKTIPHAFQTVLDWVKKNWPWLIGGLGGPLGLAVVYIIKHWDTVTKGLKAGLDFVVKWVVKPMTNYFTVTLPNAAKVLRDRVVGWWNAIGTGLRAAWNFIYKWVIAGNIQFFTVTIPNAARALKDRVVGFWNNMGVGLSNAWNNIKSRIITPMGNFFTKTIPGWASTMRDKVKGFFSGMRDGIGTIWNGIKEKVKSPINWVIDHVWNHGIVAVWKKITGWIGLGNKLGTIKLLAAGGTVGNKPFGMFNRPTAIVGEGNPAYPEYVIPTDPKYAGRGKALWQAAGGHFMKDGGILGTIGSALKTAGGAVISGVKSAADFLTDPFGMAKKLFSAVFHGIGSLGKNPWVDMVTKLPHMAVDGLLSAVKKMGGSLLGAVGLGGGSGGSGVARWRGIVQILLRQLGQPAAYTDMTLRRMNQESGGNPTIVNKWDSNWKAGHPSVGLMQVIRGTFQHYAGKYRNTGPFSYGVSVNPAANIYSSMRYALAAYGSLPRAYNRAGGYRNGTTSAAGGMHLFGEDGPEMGFSPAGWRILNSRQSRGLGGGVVIERLVLENHGVIGSQHEVENWLVDSLTDLKRKGRLSS